MKHKKRVNLSIDIKLLELIQALSENSGISMSMIVNEILSDHFRCNGVRDKLEKIGISSTGM